MTIENKQNKQNKQNRDFERHGVYTAGYTQENKFKFKNSLVITPFYETEFDVSGGIRYIKNHDDRIFFTNDSIFAITNGIQKMPVLVKRGIKKHAAKKKLIVEENYNYEEKYNINKNIVLYYEENRMDFQIIFDKSDLNANIKDITTEFFLSLSVPGIDEDEITYKKYDGKGEYKSAAADFFDSNNNNNNNLEYVVLRYGKYGESYMTLYPDKKHFISYKNNSMCFVTPNNPYQEKNYINLKIYLDKYKIT